MTDTGRESRSTPAERPSDELVLAAIERAGRHRAGEDTAVPIWAIVDHLGIARRSSAARRVGSRLDLLGETGWLAQSRRHSVSTWELTDIGRERLALALGAGVQLPESPQHRAWRTSRALAEREIGRFRESVSERLQRASLLLDAHEPAHSDSWFALAEQLQQACWLLASASYCLREWVEPDEGRADIDTLEDPADAAVDPGEHALRRARRAGRRNVRLWDE